MKKDICLDFDGVLNTYKGWKGENELFEMRDGSKEFRQRISKDYNIIILSTRKKELIKSWLDKYNLSKYIVKITDIKPPAVLYIDDRGLNFSGNFEQTIEEIKNFVPHWKKNR